MSKWSQQDSKSNSGRKKGIPFLDHPYQGKSKSPFHLSRPKRETAALRSHNVGPNTIRGKRTQHPMFRSSGPTELLPASCMDFWSCFCLRKTGIVEYAKTGRLFYFWYWSKSYPTQYISAYCYFDFIASINPSFNTSVIIWGLIYHIIIVYCRDKSLPITWQTADVPTFWIDTNAWYIF